MTNEDRPAWEKPHWLDDDASPQQVERGLLKRLIGWPLVACVIGATRDYKSTDDEDNRPM